MNVYVLHIYTDKESKKEKTVERDREKEDGVKEKNRELDRLRLEIKILRHGNQNTHLFSLNT